MAVALSVVRRCDEMNMNWCSVGLVGWVRAFSGRFGGFGGVFEGGRDGLGRRVNEARGMRGRLCSCAGVKRACGCGRLAGAATGSAGGWIVGGRRPLGSGSVSLCVPSPTICPAG